MSPCAIIAIKHSLSLSLSLIQTENHSYIITLFFHPSSFLPSFFSPIKTPCSLFVTSHHPIFLFILLFSFCKWTLSLKLIVLALVPSRVLVFRRETACALSLQNRPFIWHFLVHGHLRDTTTVTGTFGWACSTGTILYSLVAFYYVFFCCFSQLVCICVLCVL